LSYVLIVRILPNVKFLKWYTTDLCSLSFTKIWNVGFFSGGEGGNGGGLPLSTPQLGPSSGCHTRYHGFTNIVLLDLLHLYIFYMVNKYFKNRNMTYKALK